MGELAAVLTSVCWTLSSITFTIAGRRVGASILNRMRLAFAVLWICLMHWLTQGSLFPLNASLDRWFWLGLSGIAGLVLGDLFLFEGYVRIGPRLSTLMMALAPVLSAVLAWLFLGENLRLVQMLGIVLTVSGISIVILDKSNGNGGAVDRRQYLIGILAALGGATGQAVGLILAKRGMSGSFPSLSATAIRMIVAAATVWLITLFSGKTRETISAMQNRKTLAVIAAGSIVGPFIGVWLSIYSIQFTLVGIASALQSLPPIFILPVARWGFKEKYGFQAILGTIVSMVGVAVLFLL